MDDQPTHGVDQPEDLPAALASEGEQIRRLIDAGAGSPEELRELAARLREHRAREEALWRKNVKPALVKESKGRLRGHVGGPKEPKASSLPGLFNVGLAVVAMVLVVVVAASTTVLVLVVPLIGLLAWAWRHGRDTMR